MAERQDVGDMVVPKAMKILATLLAILLAALGILALSEAYRAYSSPGNYHFGSEAMLFHGGWVYQTRGTYVGTMAVEVALLLVSSLAAVIFVRLGKRRYFALAIGAAVIVVAVHMAANTPVA